MRTDPRDVDRRFAEIVRHLTNDGVATDGECVSAPPPDRPGSHPASLRAARAGAVAGGAMALLAGVLIGVSDRVGSLEATWQVALGALWLLVVVPGGALVGSVVLSRLRRDHQPVTR